MRLVQESYYYVIILYHNLDNKLASISLDFFGYNHLYFDKQ